MKNRNASFSERLAKVTEREWIEVCKRLSAHIDRRVGPHTRYGAHSESNLGMPAVHYYLGESIMNLLSGQWVWQEDLSLYDQLERIAGSLISKQVEKYRRSSDRLLVLMEPSQLYMLASIYSSDDSWQDLDTTYDLALMVTHDDPELRKYVEATRICYNLDAICKHLGILKNKAYNLNRRLLYKIEKWKKSRNMPGFRQNDLKKG